MCKHLNALVDAIIRSLPDGASVSKVHLVDMGGSVMELCLPPSKIEWGSIRISATFFDWAYGPLGAELDPEGSRFGFYTLETPGIASKIVKNGALQREKLTPKDFPISTKNTHFTRKCAFSALNRVDFRGFEAPKTFVHPFAGPPNLNCCRIYTSPELQTAIAPAGERIQRSDLFTKMGVFEGIEHDNGVLRS